MTDVIYRGAGCSKGRTSWTGNSETEDFISFVGFFLHYIDNLTQCEPHFSGHRLPNTPLSSIPSAHELSSLPYFTNPDSMKLIIAGYSYGSLITTLLPPVEEIVKRFGRVRKGTAEAEIRLRAVSLAAQWNKDAVLYHETHQGGKKMSCEKLRTSAHAMTMAIGGEESEPGSRRPSHESRRSLDAVRRSMERSRKKLLRQHSSEASEETLVVESLVPVDIPLPQTHYLLISLLQPPISMFATMFSHLGTGYLAERETKFLDHPTLVIYGEKDLFASQRRLRKWAESLESKPNSLLRFHEVTGAGHFWHEEGVGSKMRSYIKEWLQKIAKVSPTYQV